MINKIKRSNCNIQLLNIQFILSNSDILKMFSRLHLTQKAQLVLTTYSFLFNTSEDICDEQKIKRSKYLELHRKKINNDDQVVHMWASPLSLVFRLWVNLQLWFSHVFLFERHFLSNPLSHMYAFLLLCVFFIFRWIFLQLLLIKTDTFFKLFILFVFPQNSKRKK